MKSNVVILTPGRSGSSVLAALIARSGHWLGTDTVTASYDTFENARLVELNRRILRAAGYLGEGNGGNAPPSTGRIEGAVDSLDVEEFSAFIRECENRRPWLWKDPRLCFTMFFWCRLFDFSGCKFILLTRDTRQTWTGVVLSKLALMSMTNLRWAMGNCERSAQQFLERENIPVHTLEFEQLLQRPEHSLSQLNEFLDTKLEVSDLRAVYDGSLYTVRWSTYHYIYARLRFLANWLVRDVLRLRRRTPEESNV